MDISGNNIREEQTKILEKWRDYAACYRWLNDRSENKYSNYNNIITIPVIILSTLTGSASIGLTSLSDPIDIKYGQFVIGIASLSAGILSTIGNYFRYAQKSEAHKLAAIAWRKINRNIINTLSQKESINADFINTTRQELDRLIQQSPPIPDDIINSFEKEFEKQIVSEIKFNIKNKKKILRNTLIPDLDLRMNGLIEKTFKEYEEKIKPINKDIHLDKLMGSINENVIINVTNKEET